MKLVTGKALPGRKSFGVYVEDDGKVTPLRDMELDDLEPLIVVVGPMGAQAEFFGFHKNTYVLYFLKDSDDRQDVIDTIRGGGQFAIFGMHRPIGSPGTLEIFWNNKDTKPLTKLLAGALQFVVDTDNDKLYITHMSVRPKWRRHRLNWFMVERSRDGERRKLKVVFDDPTPVGKQFMIKYQGRIPLV